MLIPEVFPIEIMGNGGKICNQAEVIIISFNGKEKSIKRMRIIKIWEEWKE